LAEGQTPERRLGLLTDLVRADSPESAAGFLAGEPRLEIDV
jgi:hypothetical protein